MGKHVLGLVALVSTATALPAAAQVSVNFAAGSGVTSGFTVIEDHEGLMPGDSIGTNAYIFADSAGEAARPAFGSTGNFAAALAGGSATFDTGMAYSTIGFVLGSLDAYNSLTLGFEDGTSQELDGGDIIGAASFPSGNQELAATNGFVWFQSAGPKITSLTFASGQNSFEWDNIAVSSVPEPSSWALMIAGMGLVGGTLRRRSVKVAFA